MAQPSLLDLTAGLDPTAYTSITGAQLETLVGAATPYTDKGLIVVTVDANDGTPNAPDAITHDKWQNYLWVRISPNSTSAAIYVWNPNTASVADYLQWQTAFSAAIAPGAIQGYMLADGTVTKDKIANIDLSQVNGYTTLLQSSTVATVTTGAGAVNGSFAIGFTLNNGSATLAKLDTTGADGTVLANSGIGNPVWSSDYYKKSEVSLLAPPPGSIVMFANQTVPAGWLECNGASVSAITYPNLAAALVSTLDITKYCYGGTVVGGSFTLPDLRGTFVRGWDHTAGTDPNAATRTDRGDGVTGDHVGTKQVDSIKAHNHSYTTVSVVSTGLATGSGASLGSVSTGNNGAPNSETRPVNTYMMYIIKT